MQYNQGIQLQKTLKIIHSVLGNLVRKYCIQKDYVDWDVPWMGILSDAEFVFFFDHYIL